MQTSPALELDLSITATLNIKLLQLWRSQGNHRSFACTLNLDSKGKLFTPCAFISMNTAPGSVTFALSRSPGHLEQHAGSAASSFERFNEKWCCSDIMISIFSISTKYSGAGRATRVPCLLGGRPGADVTFMWLIKVFQFTPGLFPVACPDWTPPIHDYRILVKQTFNDNIVHLLVVSQ